MLYCQVGVLYVKMAMQCHWSRILVHLAFILNTDQWTSTQPVFLAPSMKSIHTSKYCRRSEDGMSLASMCRVEISPVRQAFSHSGGWLVMDKMCVIGDVTWAHFLRLSIIKASFSLPKSNPSLILNTTIGLFYLKRTRERLLLVDRSVSAALSRALSLHNGVARFDKFR